MNPDSRFGSLLLEPGGQFSLQPDGSAHRAVSSNDESGPLAVSRDAAGPPRSRRGRRGYGAALSPREREVAGLAATGHTNNEIADQLYLSGHTVKRHVAAVLRKAGVRSRKELAGWLAASDQEGLS